MVDLQAYSSIIVITIAIVIEAQLLFLVDRPSLTWIQFFLNLDWANEPIFWSGCIDGRVMICSQIQGKLGQHIATRVKFSW